MEPMRKMMTSKLLKTWSGRRDSNPRRPAWEASGWLCLQRFSVSGALYRLTASLAISSFSSLNPSNRGLIEVHFTGICTSFCAASHGHFQRLAQRGRAPIHGSSDCHHLPRPGHWLGVLPLLSSRPVTASGIIIAIFSFLSRGWGRSRGSS